MLGARDVQVVVRLHDGGLVRAPVTSAGTVAAGPLEVLVAGDDRLVSWSVANPSDVAVAVDAVALVWHELAPPAPVPMFVNGYQSWSPTRVRRLGVDADPSRVEGTFPLIRGVHHADPGVAREGELRSECVTVLRGTQSFVCVGFVGGARHDGTIRCRLAGDGSVEVHAEAWLGGAVLPGGTARALHDVRRADGDDPSVLLDEWAAVSGRLERARVDAPYQVGWCSWYHYFHGVTEDDVAHNLAAAGSWPFEVFQLDDGFQAAIGDWLTTAPTFPSGVGAVADEIIRHGMSPGLWLAPFLAAPHSAVARAHPEWLARDPATGEPLVSMFHPDWGGAMWQLDVTRDDVLAHLEVTAASLRAMGYDYLKLDFTFSSSIDGTYTDPTRTPAERVRAGYEAIRSGAGDDAFILGCGCPVGAVVGVVDAMRIGPDVAPAWDVAAGSGFPGYEESAPATRNAWVNTLARSFMHRRLWLNDPDCVMLRTSRTDLTPAAARAWALAVGLSGGLALVSDDLALLDDDARRLLDEVIALGRAADDAARHGPTPRCDDLFEEGGPTQLSAAGHRLHAALDDPVATLG